MIFLPMIEHGLEVGSGAEVDQGPLHVRDVVGQRRGVHEQRGVRAGGESAPFVGAQSQSLRGRVGRTPVVQQIAQPQLWHFLRRE